MWNRKKTALCSEIVHYLASEDFPERHLKAVKVIVTSFNESEQSEAAVFALARDLRDPDRTGGK